MVRINHQEENTERPNTTHPSAQPPSSEEDDGRRVFEVNLHAHSCLQLFAVRLTYGAAYDRRKIQSFAEKLQHTVTSLTLMECTIVIPSLQMTQSQ